MPATKLDRTTYLSFRSALRLQMSEMVSRVESLHVALAGGNLAEARRHTDHIAALAEAMRASMNVIERYTANLAASVGRS